MVVRYHVHCACTNICKVTREFVHAQKIGVPKYKIIRKSKNGMLQLKAKNRGVFVIALLENSQFLSKKRIYNLSICHFYTKCKACMAI